MTDSSGRLSSLLAEDSTNVRQAAVPPARADTGVSAYSFDFGQVRLTASRWLDNQNRTAAYLRFVDVDRLLYTFRANHDAHGFTYTVYWNTGGVARVHLANAAGNLVLGIQDMSTADGGLALQWTDSGTADHDWEMVEDGTAVRFRNVHSGKVLGVLNMSTADDASVLQWSDNGTADHRWTLLDQGDGTYKIRNAHSGKLLGVAGDSTAVGAFAVQAPDDGTADNRWRIVSA
ncbi:hypothetical protein J2X68_005849 [Streptomyces sp. 3330]|nr:hypothetical protein [Streptomyces sp. 3330]